MTLIRRLLAASLLLTAAVWAQADPRDFTLGVTPVFVNFRPMQGVLPLAVDVSNKGQDARGVVEVSGAGFYTTYPVELPQGAVKRVLVYPSTSGYGYAEVNVTLATNQGQKAIRYNPPPPEGMASTFLLISDNTGDLGFLQQRQPSLGSSSGNNVLQDSYVRAEDAPERGLAYNGMSAVVLGSGSERLSAGAIEALKNYATRGGTLVFLGGASAATLSDPRWKDILPAEAGETKTLRGSSWVASQGSEPMGESISIASLSLAKGSTAQREGSNIMLAERPLGLGKVQVWAMNLLDAPLNVWPGRRSMFVRLIRANDSTTAREFLQQFTVAGYDPYMYSGSYGGPFGSSSYYSSSGGQDPFSTELPPTNEVFMTLLGYFIVVVPVNFLVLRKLKRLELTWVTAPLISLIFAGVFLARAGELYNQKMSTATQGILLGREGADSATFVGRSQMFFPSGGSYDLKLTGVEGMTAGAGQYYYGPEGAEDGMEQFNPIDVGEVVVPGLRATNLDFKQFSYTQTVPTGKWLDIELGPISGSKRMVTVTNRSPHALTEATVVAAGRRVPLAGLEPGKAGSVFVDLLPMRQDEMPNTGADIARVTLRQKGVAVVATIRDFKAGPQIGQLVEGRSSVRMAWFADESLEAK